MASLTSTEWLTIALVFVGLINAIAALWYAKLTNRIINENRLDRRLIYLEKRFKLCSMIYSYVENSKYWEKILEAGLAEIFKDNIKLQREIDGNLMYIHPSIIVHYNKWFEIHNNLIDEFEINNQIPKGKYKELLKYSDTFLTTLSDEMQNCRNQLLEIHANSKTP